MDGTVISTLNIDHIVDSNRWEDMNFSELIEQKRILFNRYEYLMKLENKQAAKGLVEGLERLETIIARKLK